MPCDVVKNDKGVFVEKSREDRLIADKVFMSFRLGTAPKMVQIFLRFEAEREASHEAGVRACSAKTVAPNEIQLNGVGGLRTQLHAHRRSHDRTEKAK